LAPESSCSLSCVRFQLHAIRGTLTANFPPAPSDRVWYGFRTPPELELALRPCFGGHPLGKYEGSFSTVMKHLEKRLKVGFMKPFRPKFT
jgi:hypothetical protein